jgi:ABC-type transport system substrate-binding protein
VFDLVDNATFHNGEPFTAKDVVFTFNRLLDAKNKLPMRVFFSPVEGVEALGPHQVRFNLSRSYGPFLAVLSQATEIVNEKAVGEKDPKLFPVGTGPFKFVEWVKDDHITLERWDKYFRPHKPYLDRVMFYAPSDDTVRLTRAADRSLQLDPDGAAAAHRRAGAHARYEGLAGPAVLPLLPHAQREPPAAERQAAASGHRLDSRPHRAREARLLRLARRHSRSRRRSRALGPPT